MAKRKSQGSPKSRKKLKKGKSNGKSLMSKYLNCVEGRGEPILRTSTKLDTSNPVWDETFLLTVPPNSAGLTFVMLDSDGTYRGVEKTDNLGDAHMFWHEDGADGIEHTKTLQVIGKGAGKGCTLEVTYTARTQDFSRLRAKSRQRMMEREANLSDSQRQARRQRRMGNAIAMTGRALVSRVRFGEIDDMWDPVKLAAAEAARKERNQEKQLQLSFDIARQQASLHRIVYGYLDGKPDAVRLLRKLTDSKPFENVVLFTIFLNTITLAIDFDGIHEPQWDSMRYWQELGNTIFTWVFITEMVMKQTSMGLRYYCTDSFNVFDMVCCCLATVLPCCPPPLFPSTRLSFFPARSSSLRPARPLSFPPCLPQIHPTFRPVPPLEALSASVPPIARPASALLPFRWAGHRLDIDH